jgi:hypothetical protein
MLYVSCDICLQSFKLMTNFIDGLYGICCLFFQYPLMSRLQLADLQKIDLSDSWPCRSGGIPKTLRFDPVTSQTSGLFVAKFSKLPT